MKRYFLHSLLLLAAVIVMQSCSEDKLTPSVFDPDSVEYTEIDLWMIENFVKPYNIEILYKWQDIQSDYTHNLTPPAEEKAWGFADALKKIWCDPYMNVAGKYFFKKLAPKQFVLIGSIKYNSSGTYTKGSAEAGRKIIIYEVDQYDPKNAVRLKRYMKTIHHEFAHIADQTIEVPKDFERITPAYVERWDAVSDQEANNAGFITNYAMSQPSEDFAEMVGMMLSNNREEWDELMNKPDNQEAKDNLKKKEEMIVAYYRDIWDVDLYALQEACEEAIFELTNK